jgi:soluble lytic murein transglycosylase-like protein
VVIGQGGVETMAIGPSRSIVLQRVSRFLPVIERLTSNQEERRLLVGLIAQESGGNPYAIRPEPGFWKRYGSNVLKAVAASISTRDDHWVQYPDIASCSYGLCQVMYSTALEVGVTLYYPTELCDPNVGIDAGLRVLRRGMDADGRRGEFRKTLLRYNGGGDPEYPDRVLSWCADWDTFKTPVAQA